MPLEEPSPATQPSELNLPSLAAYRALQNPRLFNSTVYKQAAAAIAAGFAIRLAVAIPIAVVRILLWFVGLAVDLRSAQWDDKAISGLSFVEKSVLQLPFFLMSAMRFASPAMDEMSVISIVVEA